MKPFHNEISAKVLELLIENVDSLQKTRKKFMQFEQEETNHFKSKFFEIPYLSMLDFFLFVSSS